MQNGDTNNIKDLRITTNLTTQYKKADLGSAFLLNIIELNSIKYLNVLRFY